MINSNSTTGPEVTTLAHRHDPKTSHEAASRVSNKDVLFAAILQILAEEPRTGEEVERVYLARRADNGWPRVAPYSVKRRLSELHMAGRVADTGERRKTSSGRRAAVWAVAS